MKMLKIALLLTIFLFSGCEKNEDKLNYEPKYSDNPPFNEKVYIFGIHPLHNPKRLFEVYQPLVDYINSNLKDAKLKLEASRNYGAFEEKLYNGHFHFALPNPYQSVISIKKGYEVFGKMGDDENFRGIILIRKDSNIKEISDLKGKTLSYPAPTALAATMMPQWYLHTHGIDVNKDITNLYVGSQESSIMNVYLKNSDASATWPPPWEAFIKERPEIAKEVEVKWQTKPLLNNALVVRSDVSKELTQKIADILFSLHTHDIGKKILKPMELSRFEEANNSTYEVVNDFLLKFGKEVRKITEVSKNH